jgi:hypothetical protein
VKGTTVERLARKYLLAELPGFRSRRSLIYSEPLDYLLRGFDFEPSGFDRYAFYVWVFVQALYVPRHGICYEFGDRLGTRDGDPGQRWHLRPDTDEEQLMARILKLMKRDGLPFLKRLRTPADVAARAARSARSSKNPNDFELWAYSLILLGKKSEALKVLDRLHEACIDTSEEFDAPVTWVLEMDERCQRMRAALERDLSEAVALLNEWRDYTLHSLRLVRST